MKRKFTPIFGDLSKLTAQQQEEYVLAACEHLQVPPELGLVRLALMDSGDGARSLLLYVLRGATDLIRERRKIDVDSTDEANGDGYVGWKVRGHDSAGRHEIGVGAVSIKGLSGRSIADAVKTAHTQALRRMTLQFVGGGFLDESEVQERTTNLASSATPLAQIAQPTSPMNTSAGQDITEVKPSPTVPNATPPEPVAEPKRRKRRNTVSLDAEGQEAPIPEPKIAVLEPSQSEKLQEELEPLPEPKFTPEMANTAILMATEALAAPVEPQPTVEEKPFVGTRPTKEQNDQFRSKLSVLVNDVLPRAGFLQSQKLGSRNKKLGMFVQCMFPIADLKNLNCEQQNYFLDWMDRKIAEIGAPAVVALINKQIGEELS